MKTVALICDMNYYYCAIKGFERSVVAEMVETQEARIKSSSVFYKAKVVSTIFRLDEQFNRVALNSGFFIAASDATDNLHKSARCTG